VVTGGLGFVGSHTSKALRELGYTVLDYDLKQGLDIRIFEQFVTTVNEGDKVLHLAAIARFSEADADPINAIETNVYGTKNVAEACEIRGAERLVYASTGSVYMPIQQEPPITEKFRAIGNSVYGVSKYVGEEWVRNECQETPYIILRYAHLYGEGKIGHGAIGGFIDRMNRGLAPILYGGAQSNDFTYISDIVQANILALEAPKKAFNQEYNIGTGHELTTEEVFIQLQKFFKYDKEFDRLEQRTVDANRFVYDISKSRKLLKYSPQFTFEEGMKDWYDKK
jgi:UDP-glucose 4-epimerase